MEKGIDRRNFVKGAAVGAAGLVAAGALAANASLMAKLDSMKLAEPLSQREREILPLMVRGHSVAAMAQELFISENMVRGHTKNVYRKLNVHSRQQLMDLLDN